MRPPHHPACYPFILEYFYNSITIRLHVSKHALRRHLHDTRLSICIGESQQSFGLRLKHSQFGCCCRQTAQSAQAQSAKDSEKLKKAEEGPQSNDDVTQGVANSNINSKTFK